MTLPEQTQKRWPYVFKRINQREPYPGGQTSVRGAAAKRAPNATHDVLQRQGGLSSGGTPPVRRRGAARAGQHSNNAPRSSSSSSSSSSNAPDMTKQHRVKTGLSPDSPAVSYLLRRHAAAGVRGRGRRAGGRGGLFPRREAVKCHAMRVKRCEVRWVR